jgi:hypothetical protein
MTEQFGNVIMQNLNLDNQNQQQPNNLVIDQSNLNIGSGSDGKKKESKLKFLRKLRRNHKVSQSLLKNNYKLYNG